MYFSKNISRCVVHGARVSVKSGDAPIGCAAMATRDYTVVWDVEGRRLSCRMVSRPGMNK